MRPGRRPYAMPRQLPPGLRGTAVRIGPGQLDVGGDPLHFFDGHGQVVADYAGSAARPFLHRDEPLS